MGCVSSSSPLRYGDCCDSFGKIRSALLVWVQSPPLHQSVLGHFTCESHGSGPYPLVKLQRPAAHVDMRRQSLSLIGALDDVWTVDRT